MKAAATGGLTAVRTEGGLISPDIIAALSNPGANLMGLRAEDYHLDGTRLTEAITRSWNRMLGEWTRFQEARSRITSGDPAIGVTRERFLLPLFSELGYGRLVPARGLEAGGRTYSISHLWNRTPIHLVGCGVDLDRRQPGVAGAAQASPHGLVQELLNRSEEYLWGIVSNGLRLRILRNNRSLTRQAYIEIDLEAVFESELYADFVTLWLLCHQSRMEAGRPEECWLERWSALGWEQGARALDTLRDGVQKAIESLGRGFLAHRSSSRLRERLKTGELSSMDLYRQLLRLVYRLLFLFVAEDRGALHPPGTSAEAVSAYRDFYSTHRLRMLAEQIRGSAHADLYGGLRTVMRLLGSLGAPELGLPTLGSFLWADESVADLILCDLSNSFLLEAVRCLGFTRRGKDLWRVDFRNLGSEELGSVYESLLELHPEVDVDAHAFNLTVAPGHERKTTGSYYTPHSLVQCLLDSALDPVLNEAATQPSAEKSILALRVCDPATGSGHFLMAAAHRMARRLASVRTGDEEASPEAMRHALRDIVGKCLYGVDVNPMAVELCKVSLWMEALEPGKPLSFLDSHVLCGNSLLGTTPELMAKGIPDRAIGVLTGDDKSVATQHRKRNREESGGARSLWVESMPRLPAVDVTDDSDLPAVEAIEEEYRRLLRSDAYCQAKLTADAWCAAFVWPRRKGQSLPPMTHGLWDTLARTPENIPTAVLTEVERIAEGYRFLHWHIAFPDVFGGERPGFDVVLGNPPWERIKLQEAEWFAERRPDIAKAKNASQRKQMIEELIEQDPALHAGFLDDRRQAEGESEIVRSSGRYPLCGRGDVNTYSIFAELGRSLLSETGRMGMIVPSGIATDDTTKYFFAEIVARPELVSLYEFENWGFFEAGHGHMLRFALFTLARSGCPDGLADFVFQCREVTELSADDRHFRLSPQDIALMNPNTRTCPIFRTRRDANLARSIYQRVPVLIRESEPQQNPWGIEFLRMIDMSNDSGLFRTREDLESQGFTLQGNRFCKGRELLLPLYEAKMMNQYDHRYGDYASAARGERTHVLPGVPVDSKANPAFSPLPFYWVPSAEVEARLEGRWAHGWLLGWRDVTDSRASARTVIATIVPSVGVGNKIPLMLTAYPAPLAACLDADMCSFVLDFSARQKIGGTTLNYFYLKQLPVLPPSVYDQPCPWPERSGQTLADWILPRVLELVYTANDMEPFARDCGYSGPPFRWNEERRFQLRCELDAAFFHLYGISRDDVDYIMETFPIVKRHDERVRGCFATKDAILAEFDRLAALRSESGGREGHQRV